VTTHSDGSADFSSPDGKEHGTISYGKDGSIAVSMPWYSSAPVVMSKATLARVASAYRTQGGARSASNIVGHPMSNCNLLANAVITAQAQYNTALATAILVVGANIVADFLSAGLALIAVGTNFVVLYGLASAGSALQDAENNQASAGC
jgi:hypothetical protein